MEDIDLDNDIICGICYAEFLDDDDLKLHITLYHLNESNKNRFCYFCSKIFSDVETFALHIRNSHLITLKICKYCTRIYNDAHSLSKHERKHKNSLYHPKIACSHCISVFKNKKELESHEYEKHNDRKDGIMLQHCFPELSTVLNMNIRKLFNSFHENDLYRCVVCEFSTANINTYLSHLKTKKCQSLSCNICCNVYSYKSRLESHCKTHKTLREKNFGNERCPKCDKFVYHTKLKAHIKECMKCIPCNISFDTVDNFAQHVTTHSQRTPIQFENCKYCRRPFVGSKALQKHIERSHKNNLHLYKYNCIYCDIVFKHPKLLFGHFFTKHRDINPYTCKICDKGFRIRKNFTLHIKLDHKSVGFVEFDSNFHVFFTDKRSEKPFQPKVPNVYEFLDKKTDEDLSTDNNKCNACPMINVKNNSTTETNTVFEDTIKENGINKFNTQNKTTSDEIKITSTIDSTDKETENTQEINDNNDKNTIKHNTKESITETVQTLCEKKESCINEVVKQTGSVNSDVVMIDNIAEDKRKTRRKRKMSEVNTRKRQNVKSHDNSSDSDMPLSRIINKKRKKKQTKRKKNNRSNDKISKRKKKFICLKCDRNCYTYQNYHRHMSLHIKNGYKICVKCFEKFRTREQLSNHMKSEHSSSELTETLKKLLDKRKSTNTTKNPPILQDSIISKTIQKMVIEPSDAEVTITRVENNVLSVKKFLETFKPDTMDMTKKISVSNSLSIRPIVNSRMEPLIKMKKFEPEPTITYPPKLRMPIKYHEEERQEHKVTIKLVHCEDVAPIVNIDQEVIVTDTQADGSEVQTKTDTIPEVDHEVLLGDTNTNGVTLVKKTIVLKDLLSYNNVRIGHLAPKAPFYKIVKIDEVLQDKPKKVEPPKPIDITLPNGTKLVNVNPLAHLLGNKTIRDIPKSNLYKNKPYGYKPKMQDFREAIVKAMKVLDKTPAKRKITKNAAHAVE